MTFTLTTAPTQKPKTARSLKAVAKQPAQKKTKTEMVLRLLRRPKGATIEELGKATDWQAHSVRGFLSGTVKKRMGLEVTSEKDSKGIRRYRLDGDTTTGR